MLSILRSSVRGVYVTSLRSAKLIPANINNQQARWTSTYRAAILEDFKKRLIVENITNRTKLGDDMVNSPYIPLNKFQY